MVLSHCRDPLHLGSLGLDPCSFCSNTTGLTPVQEKHDRRVEWKIINVPFWPLALCLLPSMPCQMDPLCLSSLSSLPREARLFLARNTHRPTSPSPPHGILAPGTWAAAGGSWAH